MDSHSDYSADPRVLQLTNSFVAVLIQRIIENHDIKIPNDDQVWLYFANDITSTCFLGSLNTNKFT